MNDAVADIELTEDEEREFQARLAEEREFAERYREEQGFEKRYTKETLTNVRSEVRRLKAEAALLRQDIAEIIAQHGPAVGEVDILRRTLVRALADIQTVRAAIPEIPPQIDAEALRADLTAVLSGELAKRLERVSSTIISSRNNFTTTAPGFVPPPGSVHGYYLRDDGTWQPAGTGDPWTYVKLAADFTTNLTTPQVVPGLAFSPALANATYLVEGFLLTQSTATTTGADPGVTFPAGLTDGAARIDSTNSATTTVISNLNFSAGGAVNATGIPVANESFPATLTATFLTGAAPSGSFQITLTAE